MTGWRAPHTRADFAWYLGRGAFFVILGLAITFVLHETLPVRLFERANLDAFAVLFGRIDGSDRVAEVVITDQDYAEVFGGQSPLNPKKVADLVRAIDQAGAAVIGVDILTEAWPLDAADQLEKEIPRTPIVWVRDVVIRGGQAQGERSGTRKDWNCWGPVLLHEIGGVARDYERRIRLNTEKNPVPAFTEVTVSVYEAHSRKPCGVINLPAGAADEREVIPYAGHLAPTQRIPASAVLAVLNQPAWKKRALFEGKIVLLGGAFEASRDYYTTPFEERAYGVDILARIVAADVAHQLIKSAAWWSFFFIDAMLGIILVLAGWFLSPLWLFAAAGATVILVLALSMFLFQEFQVYLSFVPMLLAVGVHFVIEHVSHGIPRWAGGVAAPDSAASRGRRA